MTIAATQKKGKAAIKRIAMGYLLQKEEEAESSYQEERKRIAAKERKRIAATQQRRMG